MLYAIAFKAFLKMAPIKNNRGDLLNSMVGIIIAVIGLTLFVVALVGLYKQSVNQEKENAKVTLNGIIGKIDNLKDGESNDFAIQGFEGGEKWSLVAWSKEAKDDKRPGRTPRALGYIGEDPGKKPEKCFFGSCLCVCPGGYQSEICQDKGVCRNLDKDILNVTSLVFYGGPSGDLGLHAGQEVSMPYISFSKKLFLLNISKTSSSATIYSSYKTTQGV